MRVPVSIGPYRVIDLLGRGGMGAVYRAEHESTGAVVALKVVSAPSGAGIAGIRREIHALGRVEHPGVVRIVDQGAVDGLPWYAMELVHGRTLRATLDERGDLAHADTFVPSAALTNMDTVAPSEQLSTQARPSLARAPSMRALDVCVDLCEPLAVVHAAGLVHRDLKPDNILVTETGRPVLVDFGIAGGFGGAAGREVLASVGKVAGTLAYMAPEQIRGDLVDARADLYALGCILYECLTGATPFAEHAGYAILQAHLVEVPPAPSARNTAVSADLDALVLRLLAKRPADRIGHATDLAAMLRDLGYGSRVAPTVRPPPYLYRAELTGRADTMARAAALLDALGKSRRGGVVYAGGESGVGKTRIGVEITREATLRELTVITGQCVPTDRAGSTPLHPFVPLLHETLGIVLERGSTGPLAHHARVLAPYVPELAPSFHDFPEPPALPPDAARTRVLDAFVALILGFASAKPLVLVLDDVHWADELSLALLARLDAFRLDARGFLCVCLYRAEDATEALLGLAGSATVERWSLGRLDEGSVAEMAAGMLGTNRVPRAWGELLSRVSGGNPFFAGEYLRAAVDAGILARDARGRWLLKAADAARGETLSLPGTIDALLEARFTRLNSTELQLLATAAVLGRMLEGDVAAMAAGIEDRLALDALSGLAQRQILEEAAGGQLRFVHDRLHAAAYARLGPDEQRALHGRVAAAIETRYAVDPAQFARLARHHAGAERHDAAYWYATLAADQAAAVHANEQAIQLHRAALVAAEAGHAANVRHAESRRRLGELLYQTGRIEDAHSAYVQALARLPMDDRIHRVDLHLAIGKTLETQQLHTEALAVYAQAEDCLGNDPDKLNEEAWWRRRIQIGLERIAIHYFSGAMEALARVVGEIGPLVESRGTNQQRATFFQSLVQRDLRGARYRTSPETVTYARRSLEGFAAGSNPALTTDARFTLGAVLLWNDTLDEAEQELLTALEESEAIGNAVVQVLCLAYLAVLGRRRRDIDTTRIFSFRCLSAAEPAQMGRYVAIAEANLGWVHLMEDNPDEAAALCSKALTRWRSVSLAFPFEWLARLPLMKLADEAGRFSEADEHARAMIDVTQQLFPKQLEAALTEGDVLQALHLAKVFGFL